MAHNPGFFRMACHEMAWQYAGITIRLT